MCLSTIRQHSINAEHVMHHIAVFNRTRATGVIARHAANRALCTGRDINGEPQPIGLEPCIEMIQHNAGFDRDGASLFIKINDVTQPPTVIDDERIAHSLPTLTCSSAARQYRDFLITCNVEYAQDIGLIARDHHANWRDLVDRGIGRITSPAGTIKQHIPAHLLRQPLRER